MSICKEIMSEQSGPMVFKLMSDRLHETQQKTTF
jgi:hypothetical protein